MILDIAQFRGEGLLQEDVGRKLPSLRKRLARIEGAIAAKKRELERQDCTCGEGVMAWTGQANQMKAELERTCPVHGFRRVRIQCAVSLR